MYMMWNNIALEKFASRLKILMFLRKEDRHELSKVLGCTALRISNFRSCASRPTEKELKAMAEHYDVPLNFMMGDSKLMLITEDRDGNQSLVYKDVI